MTLNESLVFALAYGRGTQPVALPANARVAVLKPAEETSGAPPEALMISALTEPIGAPRLAECLRGARHIVVVTSDRTRPCPSAQLLPPVLDALNEVGIPDEQVTIICALGSHRRQTDDERRALVGKTVWRRVQVVDSDPEDTIALGTTAAGTPVEIDRRLVDTDAVIAVGNIEYHYFAGYSGGIKAIVPGCASLRTITANHSRMSQPGAVAARLDSNPVRMDLEEAARHVHVPFILNAILDGAGRIAAAVAGDPIVAHREGCRILDSRNRARLAEPAPVVLACPGGHPKDINLYQAQKGLDNAAHALAAGGTLVLVAECQEGLGHPTFAQWMREEPDPAARIRRLERGFVLGGHKAAAIARVMLQAGEVALVSSLPPGEMRQMGFTPYPTAQAAMDTALAHHGADAPIVVMPHAATTLPIVRSQI
ncbi:MAG: nickel-dependent lactate racemase [Chloroflexota bacterium]|nr:nickel-dependent lactate racemase [Chloroflexota bacterium]